MVLPDGVASTEAGSGGAASGMSLPAAAVPLEVAAGDVPGMGPFAWVSPGAAELVEGGIPGREPAGDDGFAAVAGEVADDPPASVSDRGCGCATCQVDAACGGCGKVTEVSAASKLSPDARLRTASDR